ncbi:MAG TPA: type II secretion system F family protein [Cellulomonas sp.]
MAETKVFEYAVRDAQGKVVKGRIEAQNQAAVANRLRTMGLAPTSITEVQTTGLQREITIPGFGERVTLKNLAVLSRQMATMISAGLSLIRTLGILADQTESKPLAKAMAQVRNDVEAGTSLSAAFEKQRSIFPPIMINIIKAGEVGGFLEKAMLSVAENFEAEVKLRSKIKSAMTYPVVVLCIAVLAVIAMLLFIVPIFQGIFESLGGELPAATQFLVWLSSVMKFALPLLVVAVVAFSVWWRKHKNDDAVRQKVDPWKIKAPIFGVVMQKIAIARFSRNFGTMLGAGVPLLQALDIVGKTAGNWVIEAAVHDIQENVRTGQPLAAPLARHEVFPPMVVQMITVGEESGALEIMLNKVSDFYDQEVEAATEQLTSMIEPIMIAFLGVVVGGMIVALYLPIFKIFDYVQ